jgi:cytochrome c553
MASVLDAVLKPSKVSTPASTKVSEDKIEELGEAAATSAEAGPSKTRSVEQVKESLPEKLEQVKESLLEKLTLSMPEAASRGDFGYIVLHAPGKKLSEQQIAEVQNYAKDLKYPRGSLIYGGNDEAD